MGLTERLSRTAGRGPLRSKQSIGTLIFLAILSLGAYSIARFGVRDEDPELRTQMISAASVMKEALVTIRDCRLARGLGLTPDDVNQTGLVGTRYSPITTTLGDLAAKRTTTNPDMAGLLVRLLREAGAREGDAVAIGASGSFPALIVATLAAAKAVGVRPVLICSLGASQWGANDSAFTWLVMEDCLVGAGIFGEEYRAIAASLGGDRDVASELDTDARSALIDAIEASGVPLIYEPDLERNVQERVRIYEHGARGARIAAFVGIGGNWADLGESHAVLDLRPGLNIGVAVPEGTGRGVAFEMAARGTPVIHLLNIRGLVQRYGLPWDPSPLPSPGTSFVYVASAARPWVPFPILASVYLGLVLAVVIGWRWFPWERRG